MNKVLLFSVAIICVALSFAFAPAGNAMMLAPVVNETVTAPDANSLLSVPVAGSEQRHTSYSWRKNADDECDVAGNDEEDPIFRAFGRRMNAAKLLLRRDGVFSASTFADCRNRALGKDEIPAMNTNTCGKTANFCVRGCRITKPAAGIYINYG